MTIRGFILGKFMPPHRGHLFLCEVARRMADRLTVLVCSTDAEPIPGDLRARWMREALPDAEVLHLHRDMPRAPQDHADFWAIWRAAVREYHPDPIDRVFASEPYVFRLAEELGATPVLIDPEREVFEASGAAVRDHPAACWRDLAPPARQHFQKRLCLIGPESVGKTWLARALAKRFKARAMPEYGRTYDIHYRQGANWTERDLRMLAETHIAMREALAPHAGPLLIEDTDVIQTAIWTEYLLGAPALDAFANAAAHADHYFLLTPEVQWADDGVRYAGDDETRAWFFDAAETRLAALGLSFDVIGGAAWPERTEKALALAAARFADRLPAAAKTASKSLHG